MPQPHSTLSASENTLNNLNEEKKAYEEKCEALDIEIKKFEDEKEKIKKQSISSFSSAAVLLKNIEVSLRTLYNQKKNYANEISRLNKEIKIAEIEELKAQAEKKRLEIDEKSTPLIEISYDLLSHQIISFFLDFKNKNLHGDEKKSAIKFLIKELKPEVDSKKDALQFIINTYPLFLGSGVLTLEFYEERNAKIQFEILNRFVNLEEEQFDHLTLEELEAQLDQVEAIIDHIMFEQDCADKKNLLKENYAALKESLPADLAANYENLIEKDPRGMEWVFLLYQKIEEKNKEQQSAQQTLEKMARQKREPVNLIQIEGEVAASSAGHHSTEEKPVAPPVETLSAVTKAGHNPIEEKTDALPVEALPVLTKIENYKDKREAEKAVYLTFWGLLGGFSKQVKVAAAENFIAHAKSYESKRDFTDQELAALRQGELGKLIREYAKTNNLPRAFVEAENSKVLMSCRQLF